MKFKISKDAWIVIAVVAFVIAFGIGVMCSVESPHIVTIEVPTKQKVVDTVTSDTATLDTIINK